ncbi:MAG: hypothetical protein JWN04_6203, partial [Myxococcaceae bacterium]|nr:hypothetical protein [Myxococcaceae bacterium]
MTGWRDPLSRLHAPKGPLGLARSRTRAPQTRLFTWLIVLGASCKACYLAAYLELPFLFGPLFDSQVYLLQARRIGEGRFGDPTLLAFSPLYGYFLAILGAHQGSILPVLVQFVLGLLNLALIRTITARLFGELAALLATALYLGYGPLLFFESKVMSETLGMFLLLMSLALIYRPSFARAAPSLCSAAGMTMALAVLTRASLLPTLPWLAASLWLRRSDEPSDSRGTLTGPRTRRTLWFTLALMLVFAAHGGWTRWHSGLFVPVILVSNTAARATHETWTGDLSVFRGAHEELVGAFSVVDQARARLARKRRGEPEPAPEPFALAGYLTQVPSKLWLTLRDQETSFDYG